ncbi:pyruvate dehydrogenase (acetyl-transferring) E1 component subunit alpha [Paenibacillus sp. KN14-4R]|uniref:pyruvate dehydrogenase (acetyl-transferring) E1 component subunit alpha n=1 Tax=Paenibacillus sp. KN14-4R TaxID=3445773 RepID=UPI003FA15D77
MKLADKELPDLFQVLTPDGELLQPLGEDLDQELMVNMYEQMNLVRLFDRKSIHLQRQGRMGTYAPFEGQEASQVGSAMALSPQDWMFPTYRDHAATITHGQPMQRVFLYWMGHMDASICPEGKRILPQCVPIATQMVHAVGAAWGSKLKGEPNVSIAYFGDGASSEGDFHEALNFAGVFNAPVIFFCQNNGYAISVPFDKQSASRTISQRAAAYDIPGIRVDGNDIFAVWLAVKEAVQRGLSGKGPTLIEAITFRYGAHTTADDPKKYRDQDVLSEQWRTQRDPIRRLRLFLEKKGLWNDLLEEKLHQKLSNQVEAALMDAESYPKTKPTAMFEHVYAEAPWQIREQEMQMQQMIAQGGLRT